MAKIYETEQKRKKKSLAWWMVIVSGAKTTWELIKWIKEIIDTKDVVVFVKDAFVWIWNHNEVVLALGLGILIGVFDFSRFRRFRIGAVFAGKQDAALVISERDLSSNDLVRYLVNEHKAFMNRDQGWAFEMQEDVEQKAHDGTITVWAKSREGAPYTKVPSEAFKDNAIEDLGVWLVFEHVMPDADGTPTPRLQIRAREEIGLGKKTTLPAYIEPRFSDREIRATWPPRQFNT